MSDQLFEQLNKEGLLSGESLSKINDQGGGKLFSVYWEIKTWMYLGVLMVSTGLGWWVYKNFEWIGHNVVLGFLVMVCLGCFFYCFRLNAPFSFQKTANRGILFDYLLLLACLTFLTIIAYLQFQYNFFGNRFGLASFIPMLVLFISAYYFDHIGVLSLGITNLAAWLGITITPIEILRLNDFNSKSIILTGLLLGAFLIAASIFTKQKHLKSHFEFTYNNFGMHILFISTIAAMFQFHPIYLLWFLLLIGISFYFYNRAMKQRSFYMILVATLYAYFGFSYVILDLLSMLSWHSLGPVYIGMIYFISSGIGLVLLLIRVNKKIHTNDSI